MFSSYQYDQRFRGYFINERRHIQQICLLLTYLLTLLSVTVLQVINRQR